MKTAMKSVLAAIALVSSTVAFAAPIYSYTYQNVTFKMSVVDNDTFTFRMKNAVDATGDWANAVTIDNFELKNFGNFTSASVVAGPGNWTRFTNSLNANGCTGGTQIKNLCFDATSPVALTNDMSWTIDVVGMFDFGLPHLKVRFLDVNGSKIGSLLSEDMILTPDDPIPDPRSIPEPTSIALVLGALGSLSLLRKKAA